jgi:hypothetical protein
LVNPSNPLVSSVQLDKSHRTGHLARQSLSLMVHADLTPPEWDVTLLDESVAIPHGPGMPLPDLVGITALPSHVPHAHQVAA